MNIRERYAYINVLRKQYRRATKKRRSEIINELIKNTKLNRDYGALLLRTNSQLKKNRKRSKPSQYLKIIKPLKELWIVSNFLCSKRLHPFIKELTRVLEEKGELKLTDEQRELLYKVSRSTVDRLLSPIKKEIFGKGKSTTKPGTLLKHKIPVHTFADWNDEVPGFLEMDAVANCGDSLRGEYISSLDAVDIATYWVEICSFMGRSQRFVTDSLDEIRDRLPFPLLGIDSDNDALFINANLLRYCQENNLTFTRSRAYKKNDNPYVEQKNWSVVRKYFGYWRYDTFKQLEIMNKINAKLSFYNNFFQPVMKLKEKIRVGSRVKRVYDKAKTPFARVLERKEISEDKKQKLLSKYATLNPKQLLKEINDLISLLLSTLTRK